MSVLSLFPIKKQRIQVAPQQNDASIGTNRSIIRHYFYGFHRRYCQRVHVSTQSSDLLICRLLSILIWFYVLIIEFLAYSNIMKPSMIVLNFLFGSSYSLKDISAIIYASGAAVYGSSIEIYLILPFVIVNCIFAMTNCDVNNSEARSSIISIFKTIALVVSNELSYQNFKRFTYKESYKLHCQTASRAMLRQSIYLSVTIIFLISPGLRSIHNSVQLKCSYLNKTIINSSCNIIDIEEPPMSDENFSCIADYTVMITGMEQLRIIRDITLCSIAFYSMYNKSFLDITGITSYIHKIILLVFFATSCSIIAVNIDPLEFSKIKLYFDLIEMIIFVILMILLILNLQSKYAHKKFMIMQENPTIFG